MKKALLIFLLIVFPWQAIAAADRAFTHVLSTHAGDGIAAMSKHLAEHEAHVGHHHDDDDDGPEHVDQSTKSIQHLNDCDHAFCLHVLLPAESAVISLALPELAPVSWPASFSDRTTLPPLPPPRARA